MKSKSILHKKINAVLRISAETYNTSVTHIKGESRVRNHAYARMLAMVVLNSNDLRFGLNLGTEEIAKILNKKSHTSVYYAKGLSRALSLEPIEQYKIEAAKILIEKEFKRIDTEMLTTY